MKDHICFIRIPVWLLYMILNLDTRYKNPYKRLEVLEQQFERCEPGNVLSGKHICVIRRSQPSEKASAFEIQMFNFAQKYG